VQPVCGRTEAPQPEGEEDYRRGTKFLLQFVDFAGSHSWGDGSWPKTDPRVLLLTCMGKFIASAQTPEPELQ